MKYVLATYVVMLAEDDLTLENGDKVADILADLAYTSAKVALGADRFNVTFDRASAKFFPLEENENESTEEPVTS